jgi:ABC superfamily ATP binding cassette transporter, ABC protein
MNDIAIKVENLNKIYKLYNKSIDRMKEALSLSKKKYSRDHYALKNISFKIKRGETVGIIGTNGSGKSTLLKIITGVLTQTSGSVQVNGKISALLELGAGFNPEYTGIENIYLNGTMMGYSKEEMDNKVDSIIEFADIGDFINQPVKTYSSGMFARLAFAVAINVEPDILIVDEALSVGDLRFQQKCFREIEKFKKDKTVLIVSHDISTINKICNKAMWINTGKNMIYGDVDKVVKAYHNYLIKETERKDLTQVSRKKGNLEMVPYINLPLVSGDVEKVGDGLADILNFALYNDQNEIVSIIEPNTYVKAVFNVLYKKVLHDIILGIEVKNQIGITIFGVNTDMMKINIDSNELLCQYEIKFKVPHLSRGKYFLSVAVASGTQNDHVQHCWAYDVYIADVLEKKGYEGGLVYLDDVEVSKKMLK